MPKSILGLLNNALIENIEEALVVINRQEEIILINQNALKLFDIAKKKEEILNKKIWEAFPPSAFLKFLSEFSQQRPSKIQEKIITFPEEKIYLLRLIPLIDQSDNKFIAGISFLKDLTQLKKIDKSIEYLITNLSHELKMPLTSIKGFVETLLEGAFQDNTTCLHFLKIINEETSRMIRLMINLLDVYPSKTEIKDLKLEPVNMENLLKKIHELFGPAASSRGIKFLLKIPQTLPRIISHEDSLIQILNNLVDNAVKFTAVKKKREVSLEARAEKDNIYITVTDNGIGIPHDEQSKIFNKFYKVKNSPGDQLGGIGLGLTIVKNTVAALGGKIKVESAPAEGSKFTVILPIKEVYKK